MSNTNPIGIFDSGVGGLTVWLEVQKLLPNENIIYVADSINCPYGTKSITDIKNLSIKVTEFLLKHNCKLIIVACNTATAAAIDTLREKYNIPFIGMEPAIKPAALTTNTGKIGVLATKGTFNGRLFQETSKKFAENVEQIIQIGEGLVELAEQGEAENTVAIPILQRNLKTMLDAGVDKIVLGCTHYPFFIPRMRELVPSHIEIINPAPAVALRTKAVLNDLNILSNNIKSNYKFISTGNKIPMEKILINLNLHHTVEVLKI